MAKIVLVNPPSPEGIKIDRDASGGLGTAERVDFSKHVKENELRYNHPIMLLYTASVLRKKGFDVRVIDNTFLQLIGKSVDEKVYENS